MLIVSKITRHPFPDIEYSTNTEYSRKEIVPTSIRGKLYDLDIPNAVPIWYTTKAPNVTAQELFNIANKAKKSKKNVINAMKNALGENWVLAIRFGNSGLPKFIDIQGNIIEPTGFVFNDVYYTKNLEG